VTPGALLLVLGSALLHVGWNAAVRSRTGHPRFVWLLTVGAGLVGCVVSGPSLWSPALWRAWPYIAATVVLNGAYFVALGQAYARAELSWVYPVSRGLAVVVVAALGLVLLRQHLPPVAWLGLALLVAGLLGMRPVDRGAMGWSLLLGGLIAGYSLVDSQAVRGAPALPYAALEFVGSALALAPTALRAPAFAPGSVWWVALVAGGASYASYLLLLFAYRLAPVGPVLAVRQIAPSLAALVGALLLHERIGWRQAAATLIIVGGTVLLALP